MSHQGSLSLNISLLPFQLDKDNREAWLHSGLCHFKAMVAATEVMPCKKMGHYYFPWSTLKHNWLHWAICPRSPAHRRSRAATETTCNFSWHQTPAGKGIRGFEQRGIEGTFWSFPSWASWEHKFFERGDPFCFHCDVLSAFSVTLRCNVSSALFRPWW